MADGQAPAWHQSIRWLKDRFAIPIADTSKRHRRWCSVPTTAASAPAKAIKLINASLPRASAARLPRWLVPPCYEDLPSPCGHRKAHMTGRNRADGCLTGDGLAGRQIHCPSSNCLTMARILTVQTTSEWPRQSRRHSVGLVHKIMLHRLPF